MQRLPRTDPRAARALRNPDADVRMAALVGSDALTEPDVPPLLDDPDRRVRAYAPAALRSLGSPQAAHAASLKTTTAPHA